MNTKKKLALAANLLIVILEIIGTAISIRNGGLGNLVYYTVLSNIAAAAVSLIFVISGIKNKGEIPRTVHTARYISSCCLFVTFTIVVTVLVPMAVPYGTADRVLYKGPQIYHHLLCPIISVLSFKLFEKTEKKLTSKHNLLGAAPTLLYAIVFVILNAARIIEGPYPFLMVYAQPLWASFLWAALILGIACFLSFLLAL